MDAIRLYEQAAEAFVTLDIESLSGQEAGETLVRWHRAEARLACAKARLTDRFDRTGAYRDDGSKTAAAWLSHHTSGSPLACRAQTRLARRLGLMPRTAAALEAGEITEHHASLLAGLADSPRKAIKDAFADYEEQLVGWATTLSFERFVAAVRQWEWLIDQDGVENQAQSDHDSRHLHLSETFQGNYAIDGQLDPVGGTEVATALRRIEHELFETDWAQAKAIHGDNTHKDHLARTAQQRRADALQEMARRSMATPADGQAPRPLFVVHLGDETLKRLCELAVGTTIAPGLLVPLLSDADIERIVYNGPSRRITDLGTRTRFFCGPLRRAIQLRDRHCQHPGCNIPADDCDIDHVIPHSKHGQTTQDNGQCRCSCHNRHKADTHPNNYPHNTEPPKADPHDTEPHVAAPHDTESSDRAEPHPQPPGPAEPHGPP